jgi:multiple sugar transport system permease protein
MQTETTQRRLIWWGVNILVLLYAFIPVFWILSLSLKDAATLTDGKYFPVSPSLDSYAKIFSNYDFLKALYNSIGICLISTLIAIVFGTMAAYAIARLQFPGKTAIVATALLVSMFPQIALVTPLFKIFTAIGLFDTWPALIIPYVTFALPLAIYTLAAFFREIPWDLEKAAKMDGATPYQAFRQVITPLAMPGVFTTAILVFIACWNDFLFALSLTSSSAARTVPAAMSYFTGATNFEKPTGPVSAAAVVITIPIVIFVLFFQRRIVAGLTSGAVKG